MNWTGGALSRSRNVKSKVSLSVKQRNHFAKARVKLQNTQRPSPPAIQYFDFGEWKPERGVHDDHRSNPVRQMAPSQRTLEQFENVQGVVRKLKSLRPRDQGQKRKRSVINDNEGDVLPSGIPLPPLSPSIIGSRPPSSSFSVQAEPTAKRSVKRLRNATPPTSHEPFPLAELDNVEAKRCKLLQESDWVGLDRQRRMSKPAKMSFTDAKDRDLIGRRRPLNDSAIRNRGTVQAPRPMKVPQITSYSEKLEGRYRGLADDCRSSSRVSIRIGSTGTTKGPDPDEILDCYQSPMLVKRPSHLENIIHYDNAGVTPKFQQQRREVAYNPAFSNESSSTFQSLFSPEEVEQSGMAQLVEAATVADGDNLSVAEDGLHLPEDYHFQEPEPGFRLVFEKTPQPHGQTSEFNVGSSPIVRDFAFTESRRSGAVIEQPARFEGRNELEEQISGPGPAEDENQSTSPLSIATSRYMQELENQSFGSGGRRVFIENKTNMAATTSAQPTLHRHKDEMRETTGDGEPEMSVKLDEVQDNENLEPAGDGDEIWRDFINLDSNNDFRRIPEQPASIHIHQSPKARLSLHDKQIQSQASPKSILQNAPPSSLDDDELLWRKFIFSDSDPIDNEWNIEEEEEARPNTPLDTQISNYNAARTQPSMIAEVATSPLKQNPHLLDETNLDDSTLAFHDDASRYANISTSSTESPGKITETTSRTPQQNLPHPSHSPNQSYSTSGTASLSPALHDNHGNNTSNNPPLPSRNPNPRFSNPPSSLRAQASSPNPAHSLQYLSAATNHPSSDELAWTPSRLPSGPPISTEKIVFRKPSRYVGEKDNAAPEPVHLGRILFRSNKKRSEKMTLAEAVERARGKVGRKGRKNGRNDGRYGGKEMEAEMEMEAEADEDEDDIVDD